MEATEMRFKLLSFSLALEILLHFNLYFDFIFFLLQCCMIIEKRSKYHYLDRLQSILLIPSFSELKRILSQRFQSLFFHFSSLLQKTKFILFLISFFTVIWTTAEGTRLYFGRKGNVYPILNLDQTHNLESKTSRIPNLASFLLLTLFPQLPFAIYFGFYQEHILPCDVALRTLMLLFLIGEISIGIIALLLLIRWRLHQFQLHCRGA